ncbi:MAG: hypothetical protein ACXIU8_07910 [Alkalilacustris sp.]
MTRRSTRRRVLLGLGAGVAGVALFGVGSLALCNRRVAALPPADVALRLAEALPEVFAPERLARHWPDRGTAEQLAAEIQARPRLAAAVAAPCPARRRAEVRAQLAEEFARGEIEVVDRLVVARSECVIAALCLGPSGRA